MKKTDIEINQEAALKPIIEIAKSIGLDDDDISLYGKYKAKITINHEKLAKSGKQGKVVLVTAISPTPAGEGKTTTTVGLGDALSLCAKDKKTIICLREPSLGPVFGMKGGAAGGGYAQVAPMEDINLHFTGDLHALTAANNLLAAMVDNHIWQGNTLNIDPRRVLWRRAVDMNDRQLRFVVGGLRGVSGGVPREDGYDITAASEVMAIFCLSKNIEDLKENLADIVVAYTYDGKPVTARELKAQGAMAALLRDAFYPNLAQTLEHTPAIIHGGPFANIAHGCNTAAATLTAVNIGDYIVTEAGFGADLGAEKFIDIKCRRIGLKPAAAVLVATVRALKHQGGGVLAAGFPNLRRHIENITLHYGLPCVVAVNKFYTDTDNELMDVCQAAKEFGADAAISEVFEKGGNGGIDLAKMVLLAMDKPNGFKYVYELDQPIKAKIECISKNIYGAGTVSYSAEALKQSKELEKLGYGALPVCIAKTQYSFSDNPKKLNAPTNFEINIRQLRLFAGAKFITAIAGDIMTMPGLPKTPAAEQIDVDENGRITGLF